MKFCPACNNSFDEELAFCPQDGTPLSDEGVTPPPATAKAPDPLVGRVMAGRFLISELLGKGGYGAVYRACQTSIQRDVAVKVIRAEHTENPAVVARFLREARAASSLSHPNIVTIYDFGRAADGTLFLAMELLEGQALSSALHQGPLSFARAVRILRQVCDGLDPAHAARIYHRDLKPDNLMLSQLGAEPDFVKILDFGIARLDAVTTQLTREGTTLGTPTYMAPEQARGESVDQRSDIYSMGIILFEMLTGAVPFAAETPLGVLMQHCEKPVPSMLDVNPGADVSPGVQALLEELLSKRAGLRPSSVREVRARLESLLSRHEPRGVTALAGERARAISPAFRRPLQAAQTSSAEPPGGATAALTASGAALAYAPTDESPVDGQVPSALLTPAPPAAGAPRDPSASPGGPASLSGPTSLSGLASLSASGPPSSAEGSLDMGATPPRRGRGPLVAVVGVALLAAGLWAWLAGPWASAPPQGSRDGGSAAAPSAGADLAPAGRVASRAATTPTGDARAVGAERSAPSAGAGAGPSPPATPAGAGALTTASPAQGATVAAEVLIISEPSAARVVAGGRTLGTTPLSLPSPTQRTHLRLLKAGYASARLRVAKGATGERRVVLRRRRVVAPPRPAPASEELDDLK